MLIIHTLYPLDTEEGLHMATQVLLMSKISQLLFIFFFSFDLHPACLIKP